MEGLESLAEYATRLEEALAHKQEHTTYNRDIHHAFLITAAVFKHAISKVHLLSNKLDFTIYGNPGMIDTVRAFLQKKGSSLDILVEEDIADNHPMLKLVEEFGGKARLRRVSRAVQANYGYNFLVMDSCGFLFAEDRKKCDAVASFHNERAAGIASRFRGKFENVWETADELTAEQYAF